MTKRFILSTTVLMTSLCLITACHDDKNTITPETEPIACEQKDIACIERASSWGTTQEPAIQAMTDSCDDNDDATCDVAIQAPEIIYPPCSISQPPCTADEDTADLPNGPKQLKGYFDEQHQMFISENPEYETDPFYEGHDYAYITRLNADGDFLGFGLINKNGWMVVPPKYDSVATPCRHGLCKVDLKSKQGLVDKTGTEIVPPIYDYIGNVIDGLLSVERDELYGVINLSGELVIPIKYQNVQPGMGDGLIAVYINNKWGYIDQQDKLVIPALFSAPFPFVNGKVVLQKEDEGYQEYVVYSDGRMVKK